MPTRSRSLAAPLLGSLLLSALAALAQPLPLGAGVSFVSLLITSAKRDRPQARSRPRPQLRRGRLPSGLGPATPSPARHAEGKAAASCARLDDASPRSARLRDPLAASAGVQPAPASKDQ
jgi:hypothetical protein